jgi:hypothetical protein
MKVLFGKYKGTEVADLPTDYITWCLENLDSKRNGPLFEEMGKQLAFRRGEGVVVKAAPAPGTWAAREIEVRTDVGRRTILAKVRGPFALHRTLYDLVPESDSDWTLTHVPTGLSVGRKLPSEAAALGLADDVASLLDWAAADNNTVARLLPDVYDRLMAARVRHGGQP